ncbi:sensor domain-containing diguanylate cyclase [Anaerotignum propionicum]|jgi:diguanylate cyclase (GGDEF)-like protein|uniref:Diguanylate cyclase (GGDEF) domain-containing protein n=1 Tax=Anaerotignum propionicum DSM 1682 TaxID=991789 RepID=A0A110A788_ANAPI|nr:GGDEF domain-containing protein [Anaerotignum propionicum]AMJ40525.1 phytochrome-like protein cph2 [Anaerotignum propionicum DSM 1682]SHE39806.1 diguanylate cyclase (GGDEF) domain-containing protein [[Clostridium] propionicum DSM 1682] [Anaerotignum propionicum DSM 1682]
MKKVILLLFSVAIVLCVFICGISIQFDLRDLSFNQENITYLSKGWQYQTQDDQVREIILPSKIPGDAGKPFQLYRTFQEPVAAGTCLAFRSSHQEVLVTIDDKAIYSFEKPIEILTFPKSPGSAWNIITLPKIRAGQVIKISIHSFYDNYQEKIGEMMLGSKSAILFQIGFDYFPAVFMSILVIIFAVMLILYGVYLFKIRHTTNFLYLGLFAFLLGVWFFAESRFIQFFLGKILLTYQMVFLSIALMPIPGNLFISNALKPKNQHTYDQLAMVSIVNFFLMIIAQALGLVDFYEWMPLSHIIIVLTMILYLHTMAEHIRTGSVGKNRLLFLGFVVFLFFALLNIIYFYISDQFDSALLLRCGTLIALIIVAKGEVDKNLELIKIGMEAAAYKKAAFTDALTQLENRYAFDMYLEEISKEPHEDSMRNAICILDVDGLKFINDSYGHWMGDQLIRNMSECIETVFHDSGRCFRIGGDEFAIILKGEREELKSYLYQLRNEIIDRNINKHSFLSASWGLAFQSDTRGKSIYEAFQLADARMYQDKERKRANKMSTESKEVVSD